MESATEDKKKAKVEKVKKCIRTAAGTSWEDQSLLEWDSGTNWGRAWRTRCEEVRSRQTSTPDSDFIVCYISLRITCQHFVNTVLLFIVCVCVCTEVEG